MIETKTFSFFMLFLNCRYDVIKDDLKKVYGSLFRIAKIDVVGAYFRNLL